MAAPKVYDWQSKQWVLVPDHEVTDGVASGRYTFEQGLDVPVVSPTGEIGSVPSEHAQEAFQKHGYRWATPDDHAAYDQRQQEQIQEQNSSALSAFGEGVVKGAVPGATYIQQAMLPAVNAITGQHGTVEDLNAGIGRAETQHPVANFAGELGGAVASPIVGAIAGKAGAIGEGLAEKALEGTAKGIVSKIATKATGSALEGAYFGLHDAANESALGDPGEIAETLMAGAGQGLIFGGVTGAAFEAAKMGATPIKKLFSGATDYLSGVSEKAAQASAKGAILPTLPSELREGAAAAIDDKTARDLFFFGGGKEAIAKTSAELESTAAEVRAQAASLKEELDYSIKGAPKDIQQHVNTSIDGAGGDLFQATTDLFADHQAQKMALEGQLQQATQPGHIFSAVDHDTDRLVKRLESYGDSFAKQKAGELENFIDAQKVGAGNVVSSGREVQISQELRERAMAGLDKLPDRARTMVENYVDGLTYALHEHPDFGPAIQAMDSKYEALDKLRDFVSDKTGGFKGSIVGRLKADPEYATEFDAIMKRFPDVAPDLQAFRSNLGNAMAEQVHLDNIRQAIRDAGVRTYGRMGADDFAEIAKAMGRGDLDAKANQLRTLQASLVDQDAGPFTKFASYLRALGREVPESILKYEGDQKALMRLHELTGRTSDGSFLENLLQKGTRGVVKSAALNLGKMALGSAVGHTLIHGPLGYAAGAVASGLVKRALNPAASLETLTRMERAINKSYKAIDKATQAAVDGLTSKASLDMALRGIGFSTNFDQRKDSFKARSDYLTQLQDPSYRANEASNKIGVAEGAPNITAAMHGQFSKGADFLASKAPVDPMAHQSIISTKTAWRPSDMELAKYERYVDSVENPLVALTNIARGRVSSEEVETLQTVYPVIFKGLQDRVLDAIMEPDLKLSYQQRVQIGTIFSLPADVSLRPNFIASMQQQFQNQDGQGPKPQGISHNPKVQFDPKANTSDVERITYS